MPPGGFHERSTPLSYPTFSTGWASARQATRPFAPPLDGAGLLFGGREGSTTALAKIDAENPTRDELAAGTKPGDVFRKYGVVRPPLTSPLDR
jgi:hypothetical protein